MSDELLVARGTSLADPLAVSHFRKADPPKTGDRYGVWGAEYSTYGLPGGSVLSFDLSKLTLADYRMMRTDYQLNASLTMLAFMIGQADWGIYTKGEETDPKLKHISETIEEGLRRQWIPLVRALSQAFWAGFAPTVLNFDTVGSSKYLEVTKFKDLIPEDCTVDWKITEGANRVRIKNYSGILHKGEKIPGEATLWWPALMENGDYYGRKLLKPAFAPWFMSQLGHLYQNRYFERFGEPTAIGKYPSGEKVLDGNGNLVDARDVMADVLLNLRSRGVVTLPSEMDPDGNPEWDIKFLESAMRGADFDRFLARLDEEKSLALFTPVLMFRTGQTGSYNLGTLHQQIFQWMLNALVGDVKTYLDAYLIKTLHDVNFGPNAPRSEIRFRTLGRLHDEGAQSILLGLIQNGGAKVTPTGLHDLGDYLGIQLEYTADQAAPGATDPAQDPPTNSGEKGATGNAPPQSAAPSSVPSQRSGPPPARHLVAAHRRLAEQVTKAYSKDPAARDAALARLKVGFKGAFVTDMAAAGADPAAAEQFFASFEGRIRDALADPPAAPAGALDAVAAVYAEHGLDLA